MRIHALHIENFRGFEKLDVTLHPSMTVLIGENGAGKTALLEALAVALDGVFYGDMPAMRRKLTGQDVRKIVHEHAGKLDLQPQLPVHIGAEGSLGSQNFRWNRIKSRMNRDGFLGRPNALAAWREGLLEAIQSGSQVELPLMAYYGTERLWLQRNALKPERRIGSRQDGYVDALNAASNHRSLAEWMYQQTLVELQNGTPIRQLRAIEHAVCANIQGTRRFFFDVRSQELMIERENGERVPFSFLSDGYRNMVALVADIAWRCVVLNPHYAEAAAEKSQGVVLIDEIELHLHPRWQRRVLGDLRRVFPNLQFVVTTHSPQVISSAHRDEVRLFENNALVPFQHYVEGRDSNSLLEDVFGVPERPEKVEREIEALGRVLDDERYDEARRLLSHLEERLGPDDPAVIRSRWTLDREAPETGGPDRSRSLSGVSCPSLRALALRAMRSRDGSQAC